MKHDIRNGSGPSLRTAMRPSTIAIAVSVVAAVVIALSPPATDAAEPEAEAALDRERGNDAEDTTLRVMTFNIRHSRARDGENSWPFRRDHVADIIRDNRVDIAGLQECYPDQIEDLQQRLPGYEWYGVGRSDGKQEGEFCPVFWRADRFERLEAGEFWLSETPDVPGSRSWDTAIERIVTRMVLRDRRTGRTLTLYNTHFDHRGREARAESAKLILERVRRLDEDAAVLVLGDVNAVPDSAPYRILTTGSAEPGEGEPADGERGSPLRDAHAVSQQPPQGPDSTWNGFREVQPGRRIDFVFVGGPIVVRSHRILDETRDGRFPSDHLPVLVEMLLRDAVE